MRERLRCSFKAKKAKNFLPAAGTYIIVNWEIDWGGPFKPKRQKNPACGRHLYYCELRERLIVPFQSQNGQKFPAWQALPLLWTERWAEGALSKPNRKKNPACDRHLYHCELREVDGALSKAKMVKKILPATGAFKSFWTESDVSLHVSHCSHATMPGFIWND